MLKTIADLAIGELDNISLPVRKFYGRKPPYYAVYCADRRTLIAFADASDINDQQRKSLSALAPVRGEIDGLIDGWREGNSRTLFGSRDSEQLRSKADRYNRRVADALIVALEGDIETAGKILAAIKQDIIDERIARARFEYLIAAAISAVALMFAAWLIASIYPLGTWSVSKPRQWTPIADRGRALSIGIMLLVMATVASLSLLFARWTSKPSPTGGSEAEKATAEESDRKASNWNAIWTSMLLLGLIIIPILTMLVLPWSSEPTLQEFAPPYQPGVALWRAAAAGSVGAFFSIAIGIRGRTVLPDLLRTSNLMDAALRVSIGFIGGAVLEALLFRNAVHLSIGSLDLNDQSLLGILIAGFVAGFSERLVPDLLAKVNVQPGAMPSPPSAPVKTDPPDTNTIQQAGAGAAAAADPKAAVPAPPPDLSPGEADEDGCVSDHEITDADRTDDRDLPAASGGVAPTAAGGQA